ncbi:hypothetical protein T05_14885 [Trichinella murrelli]|nr:hypothetical protein T05_14885 [Trichinella murrelli]
MLWATPPANFSPCPRLFLKKILPSGYASGKFLKNICLQAMLQATPPAIFS